VEEAATEMAKYQLNRYATAPQLNSFSSLIHAFYTTESSHPAIHLTLDPSTLTFTTYTASQIGSPAHSRAGQLAFLPVENKVVVQDGGERNAIDLLSKNVTTSSSSEENLLQPIAPTTPLAQLSQLLASLSASLDTTIAYVDKVVKGEVEGNEKVGRELLETVGNVVPSTAGGEGWEEEFNKHLSDVLMVRSFCYSSP
jgi:translation initiation factor 3 subunit F